MGWCVGSCKSWNDCIRKMSLGLWLAHRFWSARIAGWDCEHVGWLLCFSIDKGSRRGLLKWQRLLCGATKN